VQVFVHSKSGLLSSREICVCLFEMREWGCSRISECASSNEHARSCMRAWGKWVGEGGTDGGKEDGGKEPDTVLRASHSHHTTTELGARAPTARIAATATKKTLTLQP
jgi:hypothetical protein